MNTFRTILQYGSLIGLATFLAIGMLAYLAAPAWNQLTRLWGCSRISAALCVLATAGLVHYAATKQVIGHISYPRTEADVSYLIDRGSFVSNDVVRLDFSRNLIVPITANFYLDAVEVQYTNDTEITEHCFNVLAATLADITPMPYDVPFANATNFNWYAYTDFVPGPVVHTNGIAEIKWQTSDSGAMVPIRTGIYTNALKIAPNIIMPNPSDTLNPLLNEDENE